MLLQELADAPLHHPGEFVHKRTGLTVNDISIAVLIAAELGSPEAQYELAKILYFGTYGEADKEKAFEWYTKAAEQGWEIAMRDIGVRYHEQLLAGDSSAAEPMLHWLRKAAETGFASSRKMLASLLLDGNGVPADLEHLLTEQIKNDGLNDAFGNDIEV